MFRGFIRWALGPLGREVLQFYQEYSLVINILVVLYGIVIFYPHFTMVNLINRLERMILEIAEQFGAPLNFETMCQELKARWTEENQEKSLFLPTKSDLWFVRFPASEVLDLLQIDENYLRIALHKLTGNPPLKSFKAVDFKILEKYRRQLKKGLRSNTPEEIRAMRK